MSGTPLAEMNADLHSTFEEMAGQFPEMDKKMLWAWAKAMVMAGEVVKNWRAKNPGKEPSAEGIAKIFGECLKRCAKEMPE